MGLLGAYEELNKIIEKKRFDGSPFGGSAKNKFNYAGSLFRRITFINEMCIDHAKKSENTIKLER